ncbi:CD63 antigen [Anabrus simplex]|uniref:CD63 antigen n=1 Tax=Anabrus simplex TaxID=316456 RepID=UPI0035A2B607
MVSCEMTCVKYLLFVFNLLFVVSGIIILTIGALILHAYEDYSTFVTDKLYTAPVILIVVGSIIFIVAFFGCCGAMKENNCMIVTFAVLLLGIFCFELAGGITGYVYKDAAEESLEKLFNESLHKYEEPSVNRSWNIVQHDLECCGVKQYTDWYSFRKDFIPPSCCAAADMSSTCPPENAYKKGCLQAFADMISSKAVVIMGVGIGIAFVQLVGVIFACCLAKSIRKEYETV